jgi:hypothetical protein
MRRAVCVGLAALSACEWPTAPRAECATWRRTVPLDAASPRGAVVQVEVVRCLTPEQARDSGWVRVGPVPR